MPQSAGFEGFEHWLGLSGGSTECIRLKGWYKLSAAGKRGIFRHCAIDVLADGVPELDCFAVFLELLRGEVLWQRGEHCGKVIRGSWKVMHLASHLGWVSWEW